MNLIQIALAVTTAACFAHSTIEASDIRHAWWARIMYVIFGGCAIYAFGWIILNHGKLV